MTPTSETTTAIQERSQEDGLIAREEWRFVALVAVVVTAITTVPYLYAYLTAPTGWRYLGIMVNVPDHVQYFSWYWDYTHANLAIDRLTPEANGPVYFNLLWWILGRLGGLIGADYVVMFQALRLVVTPAFLVLLYRICAWFLPIRSQRRLAFLVAVFASGFGWFLIVLRELFGLPQAIWGTAGYPLDIILLVYIFEPNTFYSMLSTPHLVGAALYMLAFDIVLRGEGRHPWRAALLAGLWTQFLGWQHGYDLFLVWGVLTAYGVARTIRARAIPWRLVWMGLILVGVSSPPGVYAFVLTQLDPIWRQVLDQFGNASVYSPMPWWVWVLMGPSFLLALAQQIRVGLFKFRKLNDRDLFLKAWFWSNFALLYLPTDYQVKMLNGWQVPTAILAVQFVYETLVPLVVKRWPAIGPRLPRLAAAALLLAVVPTNLYLYAWRFVDLGRHTYPYYLRSDEVAALHWLRDNGTGDDVVMASLAVGQYVPAVSGERVVLAHWAQTVDYYGKREDVTSFYATETSSADRRAILEKYDVSYVIVGPNELGPQPADYDPVPSQAKFGIPDWIEADWAVVFATDGVAILRVRR